MARSMFLAVRATGCRCQPGFSYQSTRSIPIIAEWAKRHFLVMRDRIPPESCLRFSEEYGNNLAVFQRLIDRAAGLQNFSVNHFKPSGV